MEIYRRKQEDQIEQLERQFSTFLLVCGENFHNKTFIAYELQSILASVRNATMAFNFDDDLLLRLFEKLEYVLDYADTIQDVWLPYRLSA